MTIQRLQRELKPFSSILFGFSSFFNCFQMKIKFCILNISQILNLALRLFAVNLPRVSISVLSSISGASLRRNHSSTLVSALETWTAISITRERNNIHTVFILIKRSIRFWSNVLRGKKGIVFLKTSRENSNCTLLVDCNRFSSFYTLGGQPMNVIGLYLNCCKQCF